MSLRASPSEIVLPPRLAALLLRDQKLGGEVLRTLADFTPWLVDNKLPFFPEYTDHGIQHVNDVLTASVSLISDEAWPSLTAADSAMIVLGTLLHDIAMQINEEGFVALITGNYASNANEPPWPSLWDEFLRIASRFDGRKLVSLFGDNRPVRIPPEDPYDYTKRDRVLIGEFLRQHHARMAFEIAVDAVPGPSPALALSVTDPDLRYLAGIIARSHGMELRTAVERLEPHSRREMRHVHAPFIMALLRIADYLQIHAERAPGQVLRVRTLRSPFSRGEWNVHASVRDINCTHDDPEAIYVHTEPSSATSFAKLRQLLDGIQYELDSSWAVLGQTYGRIGPLQKLGLTLRRIRSNMDEPEFGRTLPYYPVAASFDTATASLLKLLIRPLYGDVPEVGIRELLQNAVDAVRERKAVDTSARAAKGADVLISLDRENGETWLTVTDRGVGMNVEIITEYFLRAGASFRWSDAWAQDYVVNGRSAVLRSGRFGVGALAAFLVGDRLHVVTRHFRESAGAEFTAAIDDEVIELRKIECEVGTVVRIRLNSLATKRLEHTLQWDWYVLGEPKVERRAYGKVLNQTQQWPASGSLLPCEWRRLADDEYDDIQWSYWASDPFLACNGIRVIASSTYEQSFLLDNHGRRLSIERPRVSVFDASAVFPLNLQRTNVTTRGYPFDAALIRAVSRDFVAWMIVNAPENPDAVWDNDVKPRGVVSKRQFDGSSYMWPWYWSTPTGWSIAEDWAIAAVSPRSVIVTQRLEDPGCKLGLFDYRNDFVIAARSLSYSIRDANSWLRFAMGRGGGWMGPFEALTIRRRCIAVASRWWEEVQRASYFAKGTFRGMRVEQLTPHYVGIVDDSDSISAERLAAIANLPERRYAGVAYLDVLCGARDETVHPVAVAWSEIVGGPIMPYDRRARMLLPGIGAISDLIDAHEVLRRGKKTKSRA